MGTFFWHTFEATHLNWKHTTTESKIPKKIKFKFKTPPSDKVHFENVIP